MTILHEHTQHTLDEHIRLARRLALFLIAAVVLPLVQYTFLALNSGAWQLWVVSGVIFAYWLGLLVSVQLLRRGQLVPASHLMIHGLAVSFLVFTLVIVGTGVLLSFMTILIAIPLASQILPTRPARITISISFGLGLLNLGLDLFLPPYRLEVQELQTFAPIVLGLVLVIFTVSFIRRFKQLQFSVKLLVILLATSLIPVAGVTVYINQATRTELQAAASQTLASRAQLQASLIGENLIKQAELLQTLALNNIIEDEAELSTEAHTGSSSAIQADLIAKNITWRTAVEARNFEDPLIQAVVTSQAVNELREFTRTYPEMVDVVLIDRYGALIAAETPNYDYYQGDKNWWRSAYADGAGAIYFGDPAKNQFGATFGLPIALPIYADGSAEVVGVIRATYRSEAILDQIGALEFDQTGHLDLVLPGNTILEADSVQPIEEHLQSVASTAANAATEIEVEGVQSFAASAPVNSIDPEEGDFVNELGWRIFAHQSRAEVLAPLESQTRTVLLVTVLITTVVAGLAFILSQLLVRPISRLTVTAEQVAAGNLDVIAAVESNDEFGTLARTFNGMTDQLRSMITSLEDRVRARTDQLRTSAEVGRAATSILDTDQLLREAVSLITDRFGFYYAAIFTLDAAEKVAVLREATGEAGRTLKERGHQLAVTAQSMVGGAILTRQARIALDVGQGAVRFANPLLPDTRSEIALPLRVGDRVLGALDVQSIQANAFDESSAEVLQTMADQLAVALINAQTLGHAEQQARVLARLNQLSRDLALATTLDGISAAAARNIAQIVEPHRLGLSLATANLSQLMVYPLALGDSNVLGQGHLVDIKQTISGEGFRRGETLYLDDLSTSVTRHPAAAMLYAEDSRSLVVLPLRTGSRALGTLTISRAVVNGFTPDQIAQLEQMAAQLAVALENYNLSEQTRTTLQELDAANRRLIGQAWERYTRTADTLAGEWRNGQWVTDDTQALMPVTSDHGLAVPIRVRGETIGEFSVQTDDRRVWTADDVAFAQALIDQVGQVIENARLLEETERFAQREQRIRQITTRIRAAGDVQAVLQATTTELAQSLGVSRAIMRLTMGEADTTGGQRRLPSETPAA